MERTGAEGKEQTTMSGPNELKQGDAVQTPQERYWNRPVALVVVVVLMVLAIGVVPRLLHAMALKNEEAASVAAIPTVYVTTVQPSAGSVALQLSGTLSPITESPILARADGYLKKRYVDIGDHVRAGQVLGVISAPDLDQQVQQAGAMVQQSRASVQQSQASLEQSKANAGIAGVTAERWAALVKRGAVSRQANDNYQFAYSAQAAAVGAAEANLEVAKGNLSSSAANLSRYRELQGFEVIRAPFDGVITQRNVDEGALVTSTSTLLFRVAKNDVLRTYIDVPQESASSIKVGQTADLTFVQRAGKVYHGTVVRTANSLDVNTRTLLTEVDIDNHAGELLPGMYATVSFNVPQIVPTVTVPGEAMVFRANGTEIAVVGADHHVHFRDVVVGHDYGATLEIRSGLLPGESIVVNPNDATTEDARVNPVYVKQASGTLASAKGK